MSRIVVLGAGLSGMAAAYDLRAALGVRTGNTHPVFERYVLKLLEIDTLKPRAPHH